MKNKTIDSPLVPGGKASWIRDVSISRIAKGYKKYGINTSRVFSDLDCLSVYRCRCSAYKFYYPFGIEGDSKFYESLQRLEWYYMPWKWEHEVAISYLSGALSLLEVGCAHGAFLEGVNARLKLQRLVGLELNETTFKNKNNLNILNQSIQEFQYSNIEAFDVVCSFQVLEHIGEVHSFLKAKLNCLKKGGRLMISVPNNESFIQKSDSILNMPPHHVGLWNSKSLRYLGEVFNVRLLDIHYEPLQEYHIDNYMFAKYYSGYPRIVSKILKKWIK